MQVFATDRADKDVMWLHFYTGNPVMHTSLNTKQPLFLQFVAFVKATLRSFFFFGCYPRIYWVEWEGVGKGPGDICL